MREDLINTNILSDNELIFSIEYIQNNPNIVSAFLNELAEMKKLTNVILANNEMAEILLPLLKNNHSITSLKMESDETITYSICERIIATKSIKLVNCYNIPSFIIELLDNEFIKVESRSEFFYISNFMQENNLIQYSKMYYKMNVRVKIPMTEEDRNDFVIFCKINHYLKNVKCINYQKDDINFIMKTLKENHLKNISVQIPGSLLQEQNVLDIKKFNKEFKKKKIKCQLCYSEDYLKDNIFKQVIINTVKICVLIILILVGSVVCFIGTRNYIAMKKDNAIGEVVKEAIKDQESKPQLPPNKDELIIKNYYIASLLTINPDVVGWLKVNNTNIDYPVVKASDNDFYLKKNLYKESDMNGWIYMDYRNSVESLHKNTIIYGHNMYYSGVMFGTLHKAINKNWYGKNENLVISFNTMYETMNWQIFSIYKVNKTQDYLHIDFANDKDFLDYISLIKNRSINNFGIDIIPKDKIITLSTCTGDNERLVVHAKLIQNEKEESNS